MSFVEEELARLERNVWIVVGALVLLMSGCIVYRTHAKTDDALRVALAIKADSLKTVNRSRDSLAQALSGIERVAAAQHAIAERAVVRADSLTGLAERHRGRVRVADATHVMITTSDTQRVAEVREVPVQVTEQFALDSAAIAAQDDRGAQRDRELAVRVMEIGTLKTTVQLDSVAMRQLAGQVADLTAVKTPRLTFREGTVFGLALALAVKLAVALLVH